MDRLPESTVLFSVYFLLPLGSISHCRWPSCPTFSPLDFLYSLIQQITEHPLYTEPWGTSHTRMSLSSQCMFKDTDWWCKWTVLNYTESGLRVGAWVENPEAPVCACPLSPWQLLSPSRQHPRGLGALEAFCLMAHSSPPVRLRSMSSSGWGPPWSPCATHAFLSSSHITSFHYALFISA